MLNIKKYSVGKEKEELLTLGRSFIDIKYILREEINNSEVYFSNTNNMAYNRKNSNGYSNYTDPKTNNDTNTNFESLSNIAGSSIKSSTSKNNHHLKGLRSITTKNIYHLNEYENNKNILHDPNTQKSYDPIYNMKKNEIDLTNNKFLTNKQNIFNNQIYSPTKKIQYQLSKVPDYIDKPLYSSPNYMVSQNQEKKAMISKPLPTKLSFENNDLKNLKSNDNINYKNICNTNANNKNNNNNIISSSSSKNSNNNINSYENINNLKNNLNHIDNSININNINNKNTSVNNVKNIDHLKMDQKTDLFNINNSYLSQNCINTNRVKDNEIQIIESQDIIQPITSNNNEDNKDYLINNINSIYNTFCVGVIISGLIPPITKASIIEQSEYFAAPCRHLGCSIFPSFQPELLQSYVNKSIDKKKFSKEIANLCFPLGIKPCFECEFDPNPQQTFYNITENEKKESYYIATLIYFIKVSNQDFILKYKFNPITYYLNKSEKIENNKDKKFQKNMKMISSLLNHNKVFIPESISLISKYPFFSPMNKCLQCMISLQSEDMNNLINHLINEVPSPNKREQIMFYIPKVQLPIILNHEYNKFLLDSHSNYNNKYNLSTSQINTKILLEKISVENIIMIFQLILLEQKILFLENDYQMLSEISYIFLSLIYPLSWVNTFLPVLSIKTVGVLQSPAPYVMGLDEYLLQYAYQNPDIVVGNEMIIFNIMEDYFISSKTTKKIHKKDIYHEYEIFPMPDKIREYMYKELKKIKKINENKIKKNLKLAKEQEKDKENKDKENKEKDELMTDEAIDNEIRMIFIKAMIMLIGDYNNFSFYTEEVVPLFNKKAFIESHKEKSTQNFLTQMVNTQIFTQFLSNEMQLYANKKNKIKFFNDIIKDSNTDKEILDNTNNNNFNINPNYELVDTSYFQKMISEYRYLLNSEEIRKRACSSMKREMSKKKISSCKKIKKNNAIYINNNININNFSTTNDIKQINLKYKKKDTETNNDLDIGGMINPIQNDIKNQILNDISNQGSKAPEYGNYSIDYTRVMKIKKDTIPNFHSNINLSGNLFGNKSPNNNVIRVINTHSSKNVSSVQLNVPKVNKYLLYPYFLQKYNGDFSELTIKKIEEDIEIYLKKRNFTIQSQEKFHIFIISKRYAYSFNTIIPKKIYLLHSPKKTEQEKDMISYNIIKDDNNNIMNSNSINTDRNKKKYVNDNNISKEDYKKECLNMKGNKSDNNLFSWRSLNSLNKLQTNVKIEDINLIKDCFKSCCTNKNRISEVEFESLEKILQNEENKLFFAHLIIPDIKMKQQKNHKQLTTSAFDDFQEMVNIALKYLTSNEFNTCRLLTISCFVYYKIDNKKNLIYLYQNYINDIYACRLWLLNEFWVEFFSLEYEDEKKNENDLIKLFNNYNNSLNEIMDPDKASNISKNKEEIITEISLYITEIMFKLKLSTKFIINVFEKQILDEYVNDDILKENIINQINNLFDEI